jgi:chemotaxis-related protein WspD
VKGHLPGDNDCWNLIGIAGDRTCPELETFIQCNNCPVFSRAARTFFDRPAPEGYLADWSRWLAVSSEKVRGEHAGRDLTGIRSHNGTISVLIFRLGVEWLAFRTQAVAEVTTLRPMHRVPHRSNQIFAGLVNLQGQVQLCVSLHGLLGATALAPARLVVLENRERAETWAFAADEVAGIESVLISQSHDVPSTLANPEVAFSQAVLSWNGRTVGLLDEQRVFTALRSLGS